MKEKSTPISFDLGTALAIQNTSVGLWPAQARVFDQPMVAVVKRPVTEELSACREGDRLWVRETWSTFHEYDDVESRHLPSEAPTFFGHRIGNGGRRRTAEDLSFERHRYEATIRAIRVEQLSETAKADLVLEGIYSCSDIIPDGWKEERMELWDAVYGEQYSSINDPSVLRIELAFHPVNRQCEIFLTVGGMGEGAHVKFVFGNGKEKELDYFSYAELSPDGATKRARELAAELGATYRGWLT